MCILREKERVAGSAGVVERNRNGVGVNVVRKRQSKNVLQRE